MGYLLLTLLWGDLLLTLLWGDLLLTLLWGDLLLWGSSFAQPVWLCSCCQITAPIIPTCPGMMGVVVLQQLQGHIDR